MTTSLVPEINCTGKWEHDGIWRMISLREPGVFQAPCCEFWVAYIPYQLSMAELWSRNIQKGCLFCNAKDPFLFYLKDLIKYTRTLIHTHVSKSENCSPDNEVWAPLPLGRALTCCSLSWWLYQSKRLGVWLESRRWTLQPLPAKKPACTNLAVCEKDHTSFPAAKWFEYK